MKQSSGGEVPTQKSRRAAREAASRTGEACGCLERTHVEPKPQALRNEQHHPCQEETNAHTTLFQNQAYHRRHKCLLLLLDVEHHAIMHEEAQIHATIAIEIDCGVVMRLVFKS
jgi:hypothetical protein